MRSSYTFKCDPIKLATFEDRFTRYTTAEFLRKCIDKAVEDGAFFNAIYFGETRIAGEEINNIDKGALL